jgi:hypothetical protein
LKECGSIIFRVEKDVHEKKNGKDKGKERLTAGALSDPTEGQHIKTVLYHTGYSLQNGFV